MAATSKWLVHLHRFAVLYFARFLCTIFRGRGQAVQPLAADQDAIFKCSATTLARKIRRQEVSLYSSNIIALRLKHTHTNTHTHVRFISSPPSPF